MPVLVTTSTVIIGREDTVDQKPDDAFREVIASCRSLSSYDTNNLRTALPQAFVAVVAASFHIVIGISLAFSAILIPQVEAPDSDLKLTPVQTSWVASIIVLSVPVGCLIAGVLMEWIGRLNAIKLAAIPCCVGWILMATSTNIYMMLGGRILTGLGSAIGTSPAIVYITEVARPDLRGSLISTAPTLASFGMVIAYAKGAYMSWRLVAWLNIIYTLMPVILIQIFVPESPVWLVAKGRVEDAAKSLKYLYKAYPQPEHTTQSMADMHLASLQREHETSLASKMKVPSRADFAPMQKDGFRNSKWAGFLKPTGYKPMIVLFWLFLIQQFSGIYITLFFAVTFFQEVGTDINAFHASIFVGVTRFVMSLMNAWLLKRFRRRPLIMVSSLGMAACMFVSGLVTYWIKQGETGLGWIPVACLLLYVCTSMIGLLTIPWTMTAELFPTDIRGIAHSISYSMANVLMFAAIQSYRSLSDFLGGAYAVQWFFAAVSICGFGFALVFLPETHGKKLSDIQAHFSGEAKKQKKLKKQKKNGVTNRKPKQTLETVQESERMMKETV
ncbi:hypothetical protein HA402_003448 [Bradysia odoriphaga]|nr:hypothetical protein HA402_003448 [Bradysia odoriphaga]